MQECHGLPSSRVIWKTEVAERLSDGETRPLHSRLALTRIELRSGVRPRLLTGIARMWIYLGHPKHLRKKATLQSSNRDLFEAGDPRSQIGSTDFPPKVRSRIVVGFQLSLPDDDLQTNCHGTCACSKKQAFTTPARPSAVSYFQRYRIEGENRLRIHGVQVVSDAPVGKLESPLAQVGRNSRVRVTLRATRPHNVRRINLE